MLDMLDDDFFELDEELLNASDNAVYPRDNIEDEGEYKVLCLNCIGQDFFKNVSFHEDSFIRNSEIRRLFAGNKQKFESELLFDLNFSEDVLTTDQRVLQALLHKTRMNIQTLHSSSRENTTFVTRNNFFVLRKQVTTFLYQLRQLIVSERMHYDLIEQDFNLISTYLNQLNALPIAKVLHSLYNEKGNEAKSPAHHLLHGFLEWRWLHLTTMLNIQQQKIRSSDTIHIATMRETDFELALKTFMADLIFTSIAKYNKLDVLELSGSSPFVCMCIKEIWLLLQLLIEKLHNDGDHINNFWSYFNSVLNTLMESKSPYPDTKGIAPERESTVLHPNNEVLFSIWLLNGIACLQGFAKNGTFIGATHFRIKENAEFLENLVRSFNNADPTEQSLRACLLITTSLLTEWWNPKAEIFMLFWEYFHKKLNSSFFINGAAPNTLAVLSNSAEGYLEQVDNLLNNTNLNSNTASFSIFIHQLGKMLKRLEQIEMKNQVQKVMGRIFAKFSEAKLIALNEVGIHNVVILFLTLAMTAGLQEIGQRLQNIMLQIRMDRLSPSRQICIAKGHVAMLILHSDQRVSIHGYIVRFLDQVSVIGANDNKLSVMKVLFDALNRFFIRDDYFECGEYLLADMWLSDYLNQCSSSEQEKCLEFCSKLLSRNAAILPSNLVADKHLKVQQSLYRFILPHLQTVYRQCNVFTNIPDIASNFCVLANGQNGIPTFEVLFKYFTETNCVDSQASTKFLVSILSSNKADKIDEVAVIRLWIKCSTLSVNANDDIQHLTALIVKLSSFQVMCKADAAEVISAKEPLSIFFAGVGKAYDTASDVSKRDIAENLQRSIMGFEKWTPINETPQNTIKQFIVIALIILNCSRIVYVRSRPNCFFNIAMNNYILPCPLLMGKQQKLPHIQAVLKIWHLIVGGIEKLDYAVDAQLNKILNDLTVKWLPQFKWLPNQKLVSKPFVNCLLHSQSSTVRLIFDKIVSNFLSAQRRESHPFAPMAVTILTDCFIAVENDKQKIVLLYKCTMFSLMEHVMMVEDSLPSKRMAFDLFRYLFRGTVFGSEQELRDLATSSLKTLTTKYLSYHSAAYFQFVMKLIGIQSLIVQDVLVHLKEQVEAVEELRRAGPDAKLRNLLKKVEESLHLKKS